MSWPHSLEFPDLGLKRTLPFGEEVSLMSQAHRTASFSPLPPCLLLQLAPSPGHVFLLLLLVIAVSHVPGSRTIGGELKRIKGKCFRWAQGIMDGPARLKLLLFDSVSWAEDGGTFLKFSQGWL